MVRLTAVIGAALVVTADASVACCAAVGQTIGTLGNTGLSAGPHLHFEIIRDGQPIDPLPSDKR